MATTTLLDLGGSGQWMAADSKLPTWLTSEWLDTHSARMLCRLDHADDLYRLRKLVPQADRLLAYPAYPLFEELLDAADRQQLQALFVEALEAQQYLAVSPGKEATEIAIAAPPEKEGQDSVTLALVSPMPPTPSGIGNYCAEILPCLAQHYAITLVVENPDQIDSTLRETYPVIGHSRFMATGDTFDRVMYHFGNSSFHYDYFTMLRTHPGTAVLHDIYLGDNIFSNHRTLGESELRQSIYSSHSWSALPDCEASPRQSIGIYPACGGVFRDAYGVIVHNQFAREVLSLYFSEACLSQLSSSVLARAIKQLPDKDYARRQLGIAPEATVFASFGLFNTNKCFLELMEAWQASSLAEDASASLLFVGGCDDKSLERQVLTWKASLRHPEQIVITGFVDNQSYDLYLAAADVAVQLRRNSRGESSAAVLDCMGAALPTIINAHGSMAELPESQVVMLNDQFSIEELASAFTRAAADPQGMASLGQSARKYVENNHSPQAVATLYQQSMEKNYRALTKVKTDKLRRQIFLPQLQQLPAQALWDYAQQYDDIAACFGAIEPSLSGRQLLVDVSAIVTHDLKSGIQRVVRNILRELLRRRQPDFRVEAVYFDFATQKFRYARGFTEDFLNLQPTGLADDEVEAHPQDIYLGLDLFYIVAGEEPSRKWLQYWRGRGVKIVYVLYDLLPVQLPHCFPPDQIPLYTDWLSTISKLSDGVACISRSVADEYRQWLAQHAEPGDNPKIGYFHLGAELEATTTESTLNAAETRILNSLGTTPFLLMVGTIEPRKGHQQVLEALQTLWAKGESIALVIVGSTGWIDDDFIQELHKLNAESAHLHWLEFVSDALLRQLYQHSAATIMASQGEGFGLPLIEAAHFGSSLLARDLPVLREVCGDHAWYFRAEDGVELAEQLTQWLRLYREGKQPSPRGMQKKNWDESTTQLLACVVDDQWYYSE